MLSLLNLGSGQGLLRLLQFSGVLAIESKTVRHLNLEMRRINTQVVSAEASIIMVDRLD
jgi:hypothetical protein